MSTSFKELCENLKEIVASSKHRDFTLEKTTFFERDVGWYLPALSLRYLFQNTCLIFGRIVHLVGEEKSGKTSICFDLINRFLSYYQGNGVAVYIETEGKFDKEKMFAFLRPLSNELKENNLFIYEVQTLDEWIHAVLKVFQALEDRYDIPLLLIIDSIRGVTSDEVIKNVSEGNLDRNMPIDALKLTKFLEVIRGYIKGKPYLLVMTNHLKKIKNPFNPYATTYSIGGGKALSFLATWKLLIEKKDLTVNSVGSHLQIEVSMMDSNISETGRAISVLAQHLWDDKGEHYSYIDWEAASIDLLLNRISLKHVKNIIDDILKMNTVVGKHNKQYVVSPVLAGEEKLTFSDMGLKLEEKPELLLPIENSLRIIRSIPFQAGKTIEENIEEWINSKNAS
jgi:RecA/RadA recombinase